MKTFPAHPRRQSAWHLRALGVGIKLCGWACLLVGLPRVATAQCGVSVPGRFGGEVSGVAFVHANTIIVARGTQAELYNVSNPAVPVPFSPRRTIGLDAQAAKVAITPGSTRAFVLLKNGGVQLLNLDVTFQNFTSAHTLPVSDVVDIVADGPRVYIAQVDEDSSSSPFVSSLIWVFDASSGVPVYVRSINPLVDDYYAFDRLAKVGNVLWAGFHEKDSTILGVDGFDVSNPANPVRVGTALTNAPFGVDTSITALTAIGTKLLVSYRHDIHEDWLRAVNVGVPTNPAWQPPVDLNGEALCMSSSGNQLRIVIENSGIGTWDTTNPAALSYIGGYFNSSLDIEQMASASGTDYWAAGPQGLWTMNTFSPGAMTQRSAPIVPLPTAPKVVRQRGNTTVVLDYTLNALRLFDYTLPEGQQLRGSLALPFYSELLELGEIAGPIPLACVASKGNPNGDVIAIIDISNPTAPVLRSTISGFRSHLLSVSSSRLYVLTTNSEFRIYELAQPLSPQLRSTTPFGGNDYTNFTCMASWSNNAAALGTRAFGLWLINTTNATAPLVSAVWAPSTGYRVHSLAKGTSQLYVSGSAWDFEGNITDATLESLTVTNIASPVRRGVVNWANSGYREPSVYSSLTYISNPVGKFLVGVRGNESTSSGPNDGAQSNSLMIYHLLSFFAVENLPARIAYQSIPLGHGNVATSADGSRVLVAGDGAGLYQVTLPTTWAPGYWAWPADQRICVLSPGVGFLAATSANPMTATAQWYRDGVALADGPTPWGSSISGATSSEMYITNPRTADSFTAAGGLSYYHCLVTNSCGSIHSGYFSLLICGADLTNSSGGGACDGAVDVNDLLYFLAIFEIGSPAVDLDNGSGNGMQDGAVDVNDLLYFLKHFETGC